MPYDIKKMRAQEGEEPGEYVVQVDNERVRVRECGGGISHICNKERITS